MNIQDFIDNVTKQDFSKAGPLFNDLLQAKVSDALDAEKIKLSNEIYNGIEPEEVDDEEVDDVEGDDTEEQEVDEESEEPEEDSDDK